MRYSTDLMGAILNSPSAQRIIDFVAPIYGESYTALWLFEVIGRALDGLTGAADSIKNQVMPQTTDWGISYWEREFGIAPEPSWTLEQRRQNVIAKIRYIAPVNPAKLEKLASTITGVPCKLTENISKNRFSIVLNGRANALDRMASMLHAAKPAHLIMDLREDIRLSFRQTLKIRYGGTSTSEMAWNHMPDVHETSVASVPLSRGAFNYQQMHSDTPDPPAFATCLPLTRAAFDRPQVSGNPSPVENTATGVQMRTSGLYCHTHITSRLIE